MIKLLKPLAVLALLGFPLSVIGFRTGLIPFSTSFTVIGATLLLAIGVFFLGLILSFVKRADVQGSKTAKTAAMIALLPIIGLGTQIFTGSSVPRIHNISTDVVNPPAFDKVIALRNDKHNSLSYDAEKLAELQTLAYPNVKTLVTDLSLSEAHAKAKAVIESMGLELVNSDASQGIIEATETSAIWGFKDDVVVRITKQGDKTKVDLRSVSRIGQSDLGANAKRIEKFLAKFQ